MGRFAGTAVAIGTAVGMAVCIAMGGTLPATGGTLPTCAQLPLDETCDEKPLFALGMNVPRSLSSCKIRSRVMVF
eukprot:scaffold24958_cov28-Tisochrysis_lutea.AAC.1